MTTTAVAEPDDTAASCWACGRKGTNKTGRMTPGYGVQRCCVDQAACRAAVLDSVQAILTQYPRRAR